MNRFENYRAFLLRLWRADSPDQGWRASLEDLHTNQRIGFATMEQLFAFLMEHIEQDAQEGGVNPSE